MLYIKYTSYGILLWNVNFVGLMKILLAFILSSLIEIILESNIEDFIQSLKHQNIVLEVDDFENRNGTESLSYNGAIIVSGRQKVCFPLGFYLCDNTYSNTVSKCYILIVLIT